MPTAPYIVSWSISLHATSKRQAAEIAHGIITDPDNTSLYFRVEDESGRSELLDLDEKKPSDLVGLFEDILLEFGHKEQVLLSTSRIREWLEIAERRR